MLQWVKSCFLICLDHGMTGWGCYIHDSYCLWVASLILCICWVLKYTFSGAFEFWAIWNIFFCRYEAFVSSDLKGIFIVSTLLEKKQLRISFVYSLHIYFIGSLMLVPWHRGSSDSFVNPGRNSIFSMKSNAPKVPVSVRICSSI